MDESGSGSLPQGKVKQVLKDLSYQSLGLSTLQLVTLLSQAPTIGGQVSLVWRCGGQVWRSGKSGVEEVWRSGQSGVEVWVGIHVKPHNASPPAQA